MKTQKYWKYLLWDEQNRLLGVSDNGFVSNYWYDAAGERTVKESFDNEGVYVNGALSGARTGTTKYTAYISPYLVLNNGGNYTKHIYIGSQRIVSKLFNSTVFTGETPISDDPASGKNFEPKYNQQTIGLKTRFDSLGVKFNGALYTNQSNAAAIQLLDGGGTSFTPESYFYHPDHLGSSSLITNSSGDLVQHIQYVPFGEVFVEERNATWSTPYKFNGKEQDEETGLSYYGARYYDPRTSVWLSVDPLAEKYPGISSYVYCLDNPVKYVDPDGRWVASRFIQGSIGAGLGYGLYATQQSGVAYDKYGTTHFQMTGVAHITNQDLRGSVKNQNIIGGAEVGISAGASIDWNSDSFVGSLSGPNSASVPGPTIKGSLGIGISGNENSASISIGLQAGGTINSMGMKVDFSVSLTDNQASKVNNMTDVITEKWTVRNSAPQKDQNGKIVGYSGTVFTQNTKGEYVNTGIGVSCGVTKKDNQILPNNTWMSNEYKNSINGEK